MDNLKIETGIRLKRIRNLSDDTYLCSDEKTQKLYVEKFVHISCAAYYRKLLNLHSKNLAEVIAVENMGEEARVIREYAKGDSLADILSRGVLNQKYAVQIACDVCTGLEALHSLGLVHRDINPNNIIISPFDGSAKIIDFGIVRAFNGGKNKDTVILGTPGYAAPEQFGFTQSDAKTDIYAVGVLLNVMLTGKLPNESLVRGSLSRVVKKCTEIDAKLRYKSAKALKKALTCNGTVFGSLMYVIRQIPGYRRGKPLFAVIATCWYLFFMLFTYSMYLVAIEEKYNLFLLFPSFILMFIVPYVFLFNLFDIWNRLPFSKDLIKKEQRNRYILLSIVSIIVGFFGFAFC